MRSMLADQPYCEVTTMAGDLANRLLTLTPVTLVPRTSFHHAVSSLNLSCSHSPAVEGTCSSSTRHG